MKNSIGIFLYIALLLLIAFFEFTKTEESSASLVINHYKIEENKVLDSFILGYTRPLSLISVTDKQWGILPKKINKKINKKVDLVKKVSKVLVILKNKTLCIEKECFKLLGIFQKGHHDYASFYNKNSKKTVKDFSAGEIINRSIKIKSIVKKSIVFSDINSTREWSINLFDVNSSKYKPKEFE